MTTRRNMFFGCVSLAVLTVLVYLGAMKNGFINYDDPSYIYRNAITMQGLTWEGIVWSFGFHVSNWHPLTWLSHFLDIELYGLDPWGHHLTNVILHAVNTVLLFLALATSTKALRRSFIVAALFAVHPLHVESVAWVSERKDVLSTFFWLLCMLAYFAYARRPSLRTYVVVALLFILGLMSKPMVVTLPVVLLLLDVWPLGRLRAPWLGEPLESVREVRCGRVLAEKIPLLLLSAACCVATVVAQHDGGAMAPLEEFSLRFRVVNALISTCQYLRKMILPTDLALLYPLKTSYNYTQGLLAGVLILGATLWAIRLRRRHPFLLVGWAWYLITLLPVIGIVQVGVQSMADRYTYIPLIGVFIMIAWGLPRLAQRLPAREMLLGVLAFAVLVSLSLDTIRQVQVWENTITAFDHADASVEDNWIARCNLAQELFNLGFYDEACGYYKLVLETHPDLVTALSGVAAILLVKGRYVESLEYLEKALEGKKELSSVRNNMGVALIELGRPEDAVPHFVRALEIEPRYADAWNNYGIALQRMGQSEIGLRFRKLAVYLGGGTLGVGLAELVAKQQADLQVAMPQGTGSEHSSLAPSVSPSPSASPGGQEGRELPEIVSMPASVQPALN